MKGLARSLAYVLVGAALAVLTVWTASQDTRIPRDWGAVYVDADCPFCRPIMECMAAEDNSRHVVLLPVVLGRVENWNACASTKRRLAADWRPWLWVAPDSYWCPKLAAEQLAALRYVSPTEHVPTFVINGEQVTKDTTSENLFAIGSRCGLPYVPMRHQR